MLKMSPDYDLLTVMQKVEVFETALERTTGGGNDLYEVLWMKSSNSEEWLERRTKYTRSLAVMSMVGYILGLGDRHPSNLMLDQTSGRVLHIDFGDCFEVAMHRDKYPEKVPFRLTRMLIKAMEVSGIEGSYRSTCERTMGVLRDNRESLVAMLEAFVYDPLISWRLLSQNSDGTGGVGKSEVSVASSAVKEATNNNNTGNSLSGRFSRASGSMLRSDVDVGEIGALSVREPIREEPIREEDGEDEEEGVSARDVDEVDGKTEERNVIPQAHQPQRRQSQPNLQSEAMSLTQASFNKSLRMYSDIRSMAENLSSSYRIASITNTGQAGGDRGSLAHSRLDLSLRQRGLMSLREGNESVANEEALNEKALKVIQRVQDKLTGTDFAEPDTEGVAEPLDVQDQVQRLLVEATSSENLCQLFIGWCAFW